jgi:cystathionine beta-lyase
MQTATFELSLDELRARRGAKWNFYPADVLPAWVADMDYLVAPEVHEAIRRSVEEQDYGYPYRTGEETLVAAFVERMQNRFDWTVDPERVQSVTELVQCMMAAIMAFSEPGDGIVMQTPIYPPFLMTVEKTGRRLVDNPLHDDGSRFVINFEHLKSVIDARTRVMMLCSPHNPTGRVFSREELLALGNLAVEHDLIIVCDEIHADLIYGDRKHIPLALVSPEIAARTITITSATKGFNIAGLRCAVMHFGSEDLHARFRKVFPDGLMGQVAAVGVDATVAAWRYGQPWLDAVMQRLHANRDRVSQFVAAEMPAIHHYAPESTYLAWLDCRALDLPETPHTFFLTQGKVGLNDGGAFGVPGKTYVRLNFATSEAVLDTVLDRMATAVRQRT